MARPNPSPAPVSGPDRRLGLGRILTSLPVMVALLVFVMLVLRPFDASDVSPTPSAPPSAQPSGTGATTTAPAATATPVTGRLTVRSEIVPVCASDADPSECFSQPFPGVRISVTPVEPPGTTVSMLADDEGTTVFPELEPGEYMVAGTYEPNPTQPGPPDPQPIRIDAGGDDEVILTFGAGE